MDWNLVPMRYSEVLKVDVDLKVSDEASSADAGAQRRGHVVPRAARAREISEDAASYLQLFMMRLHAKADSITVDGRRRGDEASAFETLYDEEMKRLLQLFKVTEWKVILREMFITRRWAGRPSLTSSPSRTRLARRTVPPPTASAPSRRSTASRRSTPPPTTRASEDAEPVALPTTAIPTSSSPPRRPRRRPPPGGGGGGAPRALGRGQSWVVRDKAGAGSAGGGGSRADPGGLGLGEAGVFARLDSHQRARIHRAPPPDLGGKIQKQMEVLQESYPTCCAPSRRATSPTSSLKQLKVVSHLREHGELSEMDAGVLVDDINKQRKAIHYARAHALGNKSMKETLLEVPAFAFLGAKIATDESEMRSNDVKGHKWQKDCKTLLDDIIDHVKEKAYNVDEIVTGPSLLEKGSAEEPSTTGAAAASAKPGTSPDAKPGRRRRSVAEVIAVAAVNASHALDGTSKGSKGGDSPEGGRVEQTNLATSAGAKTGRRGSIFGAKKEKPAEAQRSRSTALHEVYDQLIIVKRGQLMVGQPKGAEHSRGSAISAVMIDEGTGADGGFGAEEGPPLVPGVGQPVADHQLVRAAAGQPREARPGEQAAADRARTRSRCSSSAALGARGDQQERRCRPGPAARAVVHVCRGGHAHAACASRSRPGRRPGSPSTSSAAGSSSGTRSTTRSSCSWSATSVSSSRARASRSMTAAARPVRATTSTRPTGSPPAPSCALASVWRSSRMTRCRPRSAAAANMAMAMGGLHPGLPGLAPPPQRDNSAGSSGAAAPIIKQTSSISQQRMRAHKSIRVLCLPVQDSMRLHMEAPHVYSISNDTSVRRFEGPRGSVARLSRSADLRKSVGAQSKKNLLGKDAVAGSSKRLFDMFNRGTGKDRAASQSVQILTASCR